MTTSRVFPSWWRQSVDVKLLTQARLAEMRVEAATCDEHNARAYATLREAYDAYTKAARDFGGSTETIRRNGRHYIATPVAPFDTVTRAVEELERRFAEEQKRKAEETKRREFEAEQAKRRRLADIDLAKMIVRYQAPEDTDWDGMLDLLRDRSKYLDLAIAAMETRGDWSEGFYRVSNALARFDIETDQDKLIVADLVSCMGSEDGRVFRDTTWNYGRLFGLVEDQQLVADAQRCSGALA